MHPALYITADDVVTFAYQDTDTDEVKYFDGSTTHTLGDEASFGAHPALCDGAVAWVGEGVGTDIYKAEIFFWNGGEAIRLTNDDDAGGLSDAYPAVWNGIVVWSRALTSPLDPRLFIWDGAEITQLGFTVGKYPSFDAGRIAWAECDALYIADVLSPADLNSDGSVGLQDLAQMLGNYGVAGGAEYEDGDLDDDGDVDLSDLATLLTYYS